MKLLKNTISVEGLDTALELGRKLIEQNYGVAIYKDADFDDIAIYVIAYEYLSPDWDGERFAAITDEEADLIEEKRQRQQYKELKQIYGKKQK